MEKVDFKGGGCLTSLVILEISREFQAVFSNMLGFGLCCCLLLIPDGSPLAHPPGREALEGCRICKAGGQPQQPLRAGVAVCWLLPLSTCSSPAPAADPRAICSPRKTSGALKKIRGASAWNSLWHGESQDNILAPGNMMGVWLGLQQDQDFFSSLVQCDSECQQDLQLLWA